MLADRPDMVGILSDDDPVLIWIIAGMDGERIGERIYWNAYEPQGGWPAVHALPYEFYPPHICISGNAKISGIDKWVCLVYELFNLENVKPFSDLYAQAIDGKIDGEAYATECAKLEYVALKKAKQFFIENPFPNANPARNSEYAQILNVPATFEEYFASFYDAQGELQHPGRYFKSYYDQRIAPYLEAKEAFE